MQLALGQALRKAEGWGEVRARRGVQTFKLESVQRFPASAPHPIKHMQMAVVINSDNDRVSI